MDTDRTRMVLKIQVEFFYSLYISIIKISLPWNALRMMNNELLLILFGIWSYLWDLDQCLLMLHNCKLCLCTFAATARKCALSALYLSSVNQLPLHFSWRGIAVANLVLFLLSCYGASCIMLFLFAATPTAKFTDL